MKQARSKYTRFTTEEKYLLEEAYQRSPYSSCLEFKTLAESLGCRELKIKGWFKRRRNQDGKILPLRQTVTDEQREHLEIAYQKDSMPDAHGTNEIAKMLDMKDVTIVNWFCRGRSTDHVPLSLNQEQEKYLVSIYAKTKFPQRRILIEIAEKFGSTKNQIYAWFLMKRTKDEKDGIILPRKRPRKAP